ncbi:Sec-independent protein translocase protein TatB [Candidatus Enterovibrio escicola]|uniref:Twin-arginine translocation protein TatB n=1 Tax=Candidatus Enterovibrio escicola TaxID=1927127 RepID=A0A2A5SYY9_9GAMM|nr:Sec-independent protein translocase protein TatB [Candidatus Enterovibrio escacola]PCS21116.1 Twin-arginine translocation protein TatB [Candidatus Enterovibrio escacola]
MFDIGFWELILIAAVGLIVFGPQQFLVVIRNVFHYINAVRRMACSVCYEFREELTNQEQQDCLKKAEQMGMKNLSRDLQQSIDELKQMTQDVRRPYRRNGVDDNTVHIEVDNVLESTKDKTE